MKSSLCSLDIGKTDVDVYAQVIPLNKRLNEVKQAIKYF